MSLSLSDRLAKGMARLAKIDEQKERVKKGGPIRVKSALNDLERIERQQQKARKEYIKEVMDSRTTILKGHADLNRILERFQVTQNAKNQAFDILQNSEKREILKKFDLLVMRIKSDAADEDIDLLVTALENFEEFNEALKDYTLSVVEADEKIDEEKVKSLWNMCVKPKDVQVLTRGTSTFDAIDFHAKHAILSLEEAQSDEDYDKAFATFYEKVNGLFEMYGLTYRAEAI